jgi:hypothetical protein
MPGPGSPLAGIGDRVGANNPAGPDIVTADIDIAKALGKSEVTNQRPRREPS